MFGYAALTHGELFTSQDLYDMVTTWCIHSQSLGSIGSPIILVDVLKLYLAIQKR